MPEAINFVDGRRQKLYLKATSSKAEYIRRVEDETNFPYVGRPFLSVGGGLRL
jgi:hypothetical protein